MNVLLDEQGYVTSFAFEGNLVDSVEMNQPDDPDHFQANFTAYRVRDGNLVFDETKQKALANAEAVEQYRRLREVECFSVINRGQLWYEPLTDAQRDELRQWYQTWLDGTANLVVPDRPAWLK